MPNESIIYLSDNLNSPYGNKSKEEIKNFSAKNTNWLIEKGCKIIVVACNTATTNSIDYLRNTYKIPFVGVEPAIKPAANNTKTGVVGVLATMVAKTPTTPVFVLLAAGLIAGSTPTKGIL